MAKDYRVLLMVDASHGYDRRILNGVGSFTQLVRGLTFRTHSPLEIELIRKLIQTWRPNGVLSCARVYSRELFEMFEISGIPLVQADLIDHKIDVPQIYTDGVAIARMAADYLMGLGLRSFGYVGGRGVGDDHKSHAVRLAVERHGFEFARFSGEIRRESDLTNEFDIWLRARPRPTGLLTATDWVGWHVTSACLGAGLRVPDDFTIIGIGDDSAWCQLAPVPLSSIAIAAESIGHQAISLLHRVMNGSRVPTVPIHIPPIAIVPRRSTDLIATGDPDMSAALRYIHDQAAEGINVNDVLRKVPMDRRRMERWFRRNLGRSPLAEIQRVRMAHLKKLAAESERTVDEIAELCGFSDTKVLARAFRREVGMTLLQYRRQYRNGAAR